MATLPTYPGNGSTQIAITGSISVAWPTHLEGDWGFLSIQRDRPYAQGGPPAAIATPSGWTSIADIPTGTNNFDSSRFQVFTRKATSAAESNVSVALLANDSLIMGVICTVRGAPSVSPINVMATTVTSVNVTGISMPSVTTTVDNCLILYLLSGSGNRTMTTLTNASVANIIKRLDIVTSSGGEGHLLIHTAEKLGAGTVSAATASLSNIDTSCEVTIALGAAPDPPVPYSLPEPDQISYTNDISRGIFEVPLEGGLSRRRNDVYFPGHTVNVTWILTATEYTSLMGYFLTDLKYASQPFLLDLIVDIGLPTTHKCRTVGGMPKLTQQKAGTYWVSATLQCEKNPTYTGLITYQEPDRIVFATESPFLYALIDPIEVGQFIRVISSKGIHPTGSTPLNLDGIYEVSGHVGFNVLTLTSPELVNSDWTVMAGLAGTAQYGDVSHGNVISTVTRIPTL